MPLTSKGEEIMAAMKKEYGGEKGEQVFYASRNKGTISGVDMAKLDEAVKRFADASRREKLDKILGTLDRLMGRKKRA